MLITFTMMTLSIVLWKLYSRFLKLPCSHFCLLTQGSLVLCDKKKMVVRKTTWNLNQVQPAFWYWSLNRISRNNLFLKKNNKKSQQPTATCMYNSSKVEFKYLGNKGPKKSFYLEVWKIDSIFLYKVYLLKYQKCV